MNKHSFMWVKEWNYLFIIILCISGGIVYSGSCAICYSEVKRNRVAPINVGGIELEVELAITPEERIVGLMYRNKLEDNEGMLFVFPKEEILSFWMKDTRIPISIAFIKADGRIIQIDTMSPHSLDTHVSREKVQYALEMKEGWFRLHNIKEGDIVRIPLAVGRKAEIGK
ncbi:MAG: DUF192 domain-containing protein [Candidatus Jettenia sp. CY-1]|nr:DUF192 domain-containing protein [Candidatus Jettenia sp.]WKZ19328.1 MAG: DUF192 domain-containing protein [Candidatus Jettenia sp. CY-1]